MDLKFCLLVLAIVYFHLPANFAENDYDFDYSEGSHEVQVSHEHKGVEDVLKNMYQHMLRFNQKLTMVNQRLTRVENELTSLKHGQAQQTKMPLIPKTPGVF